MSRDFGLLRSSRFLRSAYFFWSLLAVSYVLFEAFDIDGSNLTRMLAPFQRAGLAAEAPSNAAADPQEANAHREHETTISVKASPNQRPAPQFDRLRSDPRLFHRGRLLGAGSPRDSLADTPPDH